MGQEPNHHCLLLILLPHSSWTGVSDDILALQHESKIFTIHNPEHDQDALFPAELMGVELDADIVDQFHEVRRNQEPFDMGCCCTVKARPGW